MNSKSLSLNQLKNIIVLVGFTTIVSGFFSFFFSKNSLSAAPNMKSLQSVYDLDLTLNNGKTVSLQKFKGKKILFVNVASNCGYTSQYSQLQSLYESNKDQLEIIAIPCNDFGRQEPGDAEQIKTFCEVNYGVTFTIAGKQNIKSNPKSDLYEWLSNPALNGWNSALPSWNFCKYLLDEDGELIHFFKSGVSPTSNKISSVL